MPTDFIPVYDVSDLERLLKYWALGSLDSIASPHGVALGVADCDFSPVGLKPTPLLQRYTAAEVEIVMQGMAIAAPPVPVYATILIVKSLQQAPIQDIARALSCDCTTAQEWLCAAQDEFMRRLLNKDVPISHSRNTLSYSGQSMSARTK